MKIKSRNLFGGNGQESKQTRIVISRQSPQFLGLCKNTIQSDKNTRQNYQTYKYDRTVQHNFWTELLEISKCILLLKYTHLHQKKIYIFEPKVPKQNRVYQKASKNYAKIQNKNTEKSMFLY